MSSAKPKESAADHTGAEMLFRLQFGSADIGGKTFAQNEEKTAIIHAIIELSISRLYNW
jgi:hypothetical protein